MPIPQPIDPRLLAAEIESAADEFNRLVALACAHHIVVLAELSRHPQVDAPDRPILAVQIVASLRRRAASAPPPPPRRGVRRPGPDHGSIPSSQTSIAVGARPGKSPGEAVPKRPPRSDRAAFAAVWRNLLQSKNAGASPADHERDPRVPPRR
jgi:hypothetical protein